MRSINALELASLIIKALTHCRPAIIVLAGVLVALNVGAAQARDFVDHSGELTNDDRDAVMRALEAGESKSKVKVSVIVFSSLEGRAPESYVAAYRKTRTARADDVISVVIAAFVKEGVLVVDNGARIVWHTPKFVIVGLMAATVQGAFEGRAYKDGLISALDLLFQGIGVGESRDQAPKAEAVPQPHLVDVSKLTAELSKLAQGAESDVGVLAPSLTRVFEELRAAIPVAQRKLIENVVVTLSRDLTARTSDQRAPGHMASSSGRVIVGESFIKSLYTDRAAPYMYAGRLLFALAHEIGHHVLGHIRRLPTSISDQARYEVDADNFAVALLTAVRIVGDIEIASTRGGISEGFRILDDDARSRLGTNMIRLEAAGELHELARRWRLVHQAAVVQDESRPLKGRLMGDPTSILNNYVTFVMLSLRAINLFASFPEGRSSAQSTVTILKNDVQFFIHLANDTSSPEMARRAREILTIVDDSLPKYLRSIAPQ